MASYFLHGLENSLGVWSRYRKLEDGDIKSLNIPLLNLSPTTIDSILGYINPIFKEVSQVVMLKNTLDPLQFCTSSSLFNYVFIPIAPLISPVVSYYAKKGNTQAKDIQKNLAKLCFITHFIAVVLFFSEDSKTLAVGLFAGHLIGYLKPEKESKNYDLLLFILQMSSSLYLGSLFDKGVKIVLLLGNYPQQFNQAISWIQQQFFKPKEDT